MNRKFSAHILGVIIEIPEGLPVLFSSDGRVDLVKGNNGSVDPDEVYIKGHGLDVAGFQRGYDCSALRRALGNGR